MNRPPIAQNVTWVYTADIDGTARFYGETLGLEQVLDQGLCRIFRASGTAFALCSATSPSRDTPTAPLV